MEDNFKPHGEVDEAFNCKPCIGEGLLTNGVICSNCQGTGKDPKKINKEMPEGTHILTKDGEFIVNDKGELVKQ